MKKSTFYCSQCKKIVTIKHHDCTTGYASKRNNHKVCFNCCGIVDRQFMIDNGKITLYLTTNNTYNDFYGDAKINNWPSSLSFNGRYKTGRHNIAQIRYDVWFNGPDGFVWHGVQYGDFTQLVHCKRTKETCKPDNGININN